MTTGATGQLGLALPVQGELSGTWGDTVNNGITQYTNIAIAATLTLTNDGAVTLANTTGDASATNITSTLTGAGTVTAQFAIVKITGTLTTTKVVTFGSAGSPPYSKTFTVVNAATGGTVTFKAYGQTGVSIAVGESAFVYYNGTDIVKVTGTATAGAAGGSTTQVQYNSSGSLAGSSNLTFDGTSLTLGGNPTLSAGTANGVAYLNGSKVITSGSALTFDGTTLTATGNAVISANSASDALRITQTGAGNALVVEDSANPDSTPFVVTTDGRALIGGTSAVAPTSGMTPWLQLQGTTSATSSISGMRFSADANQPYYVFAKSRSATKGTFGTIVQSGDTLGTVLFTGDDGSSTPIPAASIEAAVDGTPGTNDMPGRLVFSTTADGASSPTERMRIDNAGNTGFGAASSAGRSVSISKNVTGSTVGINLFINGVAQSDATSSIRGVSTSLQTAAASFTAVEMAHFYANQSTIGAGSAVTNQYGYFVNSTLTGATNNYGFYSNIASGTGRWNFYANGTAANYFAGNVGIGTTTTTNKLEIGGSGDSIMRLLAAGQANGLEIGQLTADGSSKIFAANNNFLALGTNNTERARIDSSGNLLVGGTAARGTTAGAAHLDLFNGTAPAGTLTNGVSLYSSSGDLKFMNAAGDAYDVGYRNIPQNAQSGSYTMVLADAGKHIYHASGDGAATYTIPAASSVAYPIGTAITFINLSATSISIAITTDTMYLSSAGTTGTRTLAQYGSATAIKVSGLSSSGIWVISGSGLT